MLDLFTLAEAKSALKVLGNNLDDQLSQLIPVASQAVVDYLSGRASEVLALDASGELTSDSVVPEPVKFAAIVVLAHLFEAEDELKRAPGGLPYQAEMLLYRYADPPLI